MNSKVRNGGLSTQKTQRQRARGSRDVVEDMDGRSEMARYMLTRSQDSKRQPGTYLKVDEMKGPRRYMHLRNQFQTRYHPQCTQAWMISSAGRILWGHSPRTHSAWPVTFFVKRRSRVLWLSKRRNVAVRFYKPGLYVDALFQRGLLSHASRGWALTAGETVEEVKPISGMAQRV